jgi:CheY-like chemotaxis protein/HPt (histidine-containing phosphotransfer) domain-containing protein
MIVENNRTTLATLVDLALMWNMNVIAMDSTEAALAMMRAWRQAGLPLAFAWIGAEMPGISGYELAQAVEEQHLAQAVLLMVTFTSQASDSVRRQKFHNVSRMLKPVRRCELLKAMLSALDGAQQAASTSLLPPRHVNPAGTSLRVLVVEDIAVNQVVILRTLEKMRHTVTIANNGREALDLLARESFQLIFMDVQMPEMDGLTATRAIRAQEANHGSHTPIVAMTAHAMKGDKDRCLEAGMDDYLAKPVGRREIANVIQRIFPLNATEPAASGRLSSWTPSRALEQVEGDEKLLHEIMEIFMEEAPKLLSQLRESIAAGNLQLVERAAHKLKGQLGYLGATGAAQKSRELEDTGHRGDMGHARRLADELEREISGLMETMRQMVQP